MSYYANSSFLVSCFLPDANTSRSMRYLRSVGAPLVLNALQALEVGSAFELGVFRVCFTCHGRKIAQGGRIYISFESRQRLLATALGLKVAP